MKKNKKNIYLLSIIILGVLSRLIPHPPNFTPVGGLALFSGAYFSGLASFFIPLSIMFIADIFLGFHSTMIYVYLSFLIIVFLGKNIKKLRLISIIKMSFLSSVIFFIITNFGVWLSTNFYSKDIKGLINCYLMAVPFFKNTLFGDLFYSLGFFYGHHFLIFLEKKLLFKKA